MGIHGRRSDYRETHVCDTCTQEHVTPALKRKLAEFERLPNPDPANWKIERVEQIGPNLAIELAYPDCKNFEGKKVMVYLNTTLVDLVNQKKIDPHFSNDKKLKSPFARFEPTKDGWEMAVHIATMWADNGR